MTSDLSGQRRAWGLTRRDAGIGIIAAAAGASAPAAAADAPGLADARDVVQRVRAILPDLEAYVRQGMTDWHIPGAAVGVVVGDDVVFTAGYGVRDSMGTAPVDANTVFQTGSATKAFTAATEAIMVDRGRMAWSDRVIDHDPEFRFHDPWVTREFQIADLLAQRSGLAPYVLDAMWGLGFVAEDVVAALRYAVPVSSFRTTFAYQNILQQVAGRIVARMTGAARWQDALPGLILDPLGMHDTSSSVAAIEAAANHASGHVWFEGQLHRRPFHPMIDNVGAAGAINSTVTDMLKWLRLQTGRGSFEGRRIVGEENLTETWRPKVEMRGLPGFPSTWMAYASGWIFHLTQNGRFVWHNGGTGLFRAHAGFLPDSRVGFVMLTNEGTNALIDATGLWFYDRVLGNPEQDHNARLLADMRKQAEVQAASRRRPDPPMPSGKLAGYAGSYHSPAVKDATVTVAGEALTLAFAATGRSFRLQPWNGDSFVLLPEDADTVEQSIGDLQFMEFRRTPQGDVTELSFRDSPELTLRRQPGGS
jgi:CubicO group peptidase (beta-lactamase class C family)